MDRRQFIKVTAATSASATLASCGNPENHIIRFIPEEEIIPGIATWKPSICPLCPSGCGILVRIMQGEAEVVRNGQTGLIKMGLAKKLEGNPAHPVSQGKLCVRGQAAIQVTYHPDRITQPMKRSGDRGTGKFAPITWDAAMSELISKLDALSAAKNQKALAFLTRPMRGQRQMLIDQFLAKFGGRPSQSFEVLGDAVLRRANGRSFGHEQLPTLDLARSRYVLSLGADFLGTWNSPVAQNVAYGDMRQGAPGQRGKFVQVEPRMSQTGANADEWVAIKPGTEGVLAVGLAHVIIGEKLRPAAAAGRAGAQIDGWTAGLAAYTPAEVEKRTGVTAARIERLAREFAGHGPALAISGGAALAQTNGMFNALAVNALNALVGSVGQPGGIFFTPGNAQKAASTTMDKFAADILDAPASPIQILLLSDANPVFGTPAAWRVKEALLKVPYIASFGSFIDETSILADLLLPDHSFLESWVDHVPESGTTKTVASVAAPAMKPIHETRAMPDVLLEVARKLNPPLTPAFQWQTFDQMLQAGFGDNWAKAQEQGGIWSDSPANAAPAAAATTTAKPVALDEARFEGAESQYPFHFLPYASQAFLDGSVAHLPWLQELPDVLSTAMWSSWIEINPQTAAKMGIAQGDLLDVASTRGTLRAPALLSPGIAPDIVAMPIGQGHETYTRFASGRGANPISILAPVTEPETGALAWAATRVKIEKAGGTGQLTLFAGGMKERETEHR
ncbi:MAG: nitrate reductase [Verrucomicrobia bacterium]|nr:MAG: nitrate reductase [Verrucomicrobiota bacterium]